VVRQHDALGLFEIEAAVIEVHLSRRTLHQGVKLVALVARHVRRVVTFEDLEEPVCIVVVANPAGAKHLRDVPTTDIRYQDLEFFVDQRRLNAEHVQPHGLNGHGRPALRVRRVVTQFDSERIVFAVPRFLVQVPRHLVAFRLRHLRIAQCRRRVVVRAGWHPAVSGRFTATGYLGCELLAIDGHRQGLPQTRLTLERRLGQIEAVVVHAEVRRYVQLIVELILNLREIVRRYGTRNV